MTETRATNEYLTTREAGARRGVNASRVRQWIGQGRLVAVKVGRDWLVKACDVDAVEVLPSGGQRGRKRKPVLDRV